MSVPSGTAENSPPVHWRIQRHKSLRVPEGHIKNLYVDILSRPLVRENIALAGDDLGIGGQVDIATITRPARFQWIQGHDPSQRISSDER